MRYREFSNEDTTFTYHNINSYGNVVDVDMVRQTSSDTLLDVVVPNFRKRIASGEIIVNPFRRITYNRGADSGTMLFRHNSSSYWYQASGAVLLYYYQNIWNTDPPGWSYQEVMGHTNSTRLILAQQVAANLEQSKYAFGEDVAELHKTIGSIRGLIPDIGNIILRIPKLTEVYVRNGWTLQAALSKVWLRLRYELRPFLISLEQLIELAQNQLNVAIGKRYKVDRFEFIDFKEENIEDIALGAATVSVKTTRSYTGKLVLGALVENDDPIKDPLDILGLGVKDVLPTIWAITRFSFLVDKFVNITRLIDALQNLSDPAIHIRGSWANLSFEATAKAEVVGLTRDGYSVSFSPCSVYETLKFKNRDIGAVSFSVIDPQLEIPSWETFADLYTIFASPTLSKFMRV